MGLTIENLKKCSVKISSRVAGVPSVGSGVIYQTPSYYDYNYVITAKHILSEDYHTIFDVAKIKYIHIEYFNDTKFEQLVYLPARLLKIDKNIILFEKEDLIILKINKIEGLEFPAILVTDNLENDEKSFSCWSIFKANLDSLDLFKYSRLDPSLRRIELNSTNVEVEYLDGISGGGVFVNDKNILYGIISRYPNEKFQKATIECCNIPFEKINIKLSQLNLLLLADKSDLLKKEIDGAVVEIYQASINNAYLDLKLAMKRVKSDMVDDWFYDSLQFVDLLKDDYLFVQFREYFYKDTYKTTKAERFYIPKSNFTLREAYILPLIDRLVYMGVVGELADVVDQSLIPNVFASRYSRTDKNRLLVNGVEQWTKLKYKLHEKINQKNSNGRYKYSCILHVDILNYYDNIDKKLLIEKLKRVSTNINQLNCVNLLEQFLKYYSEKSSGIPQNNDSSALLATFYLNQVDAFMQNQTLAYYRFVDDIKILCSDKYEARKHLLILEKELKRCHLSVNSQKTKIIEIYDQEDIRGLEKEELRSNYSKIFDFSLSKIKSFSKSNNYQYRNEAFHTAVSIVRDNIRSDGEENDEKARNLRFALNIIENLANRQINSDSDNSKFYQTIKKVVRELKDEPWLTSQICKILAMTSSQTFTDNYLPTVRNIVLNKKYNLYPYQQFQLWLLLAKHKIKDDRLIQYASHSIEVNDKTKIATTAGQILYLSTVDKNFKRILLRKMDENFTEGSYFQNRASLIALRSFNLLEPKKESIHKSLKDSFQFTNKFGDKELVYYHDIEISGNHSNILEQLFSL